MGSVPEYSSIYPLPVAAMNVSSKLVVSVPGFSTNYPLQVAAKNVSTYMVSLGPRFSSIYPPPMAAKNVSTGGLGPWIFLYLSSPGGGEECFPKYGGLGPWIFVYLSSPCAVVAKNVSIESQLTVV